MHYPNNVYPYTDAMSNKGLLPRCVSLPPESIQSSGRCFIAMDGMCAGKAGAVACLCSHKKITIFRGAPLSFKLTVNIFYWLCVGTLL
jgi:hypothetical protein